MSVKLMSLVFEADLPPTQKLILLAYADHANDEGYSIWPSISKMAAKTGLSERTVQITTRKLQTDGIMISDGFSTYSTRKWRIDPKKLTALGGAGDAGGGVQEMRGGGAGDAPKTSVKTSVKSLSANVEKLNIEAPVRVVGGIYR